MSAPITPADRDAAADILDPFSDEPWAAKMLESIAQAIADARERGRLEEFERDDYHSRKHLAEALTWIENNLEQNRCDGIALVARAFLAADDILADRRSE